MENFLNYLKKLIFLHPIILFIENIVFVVLLFIIFNKQLQDDIFINFIYVISAYILVVDVVNIFNIANVLKKHVYSYPIIHKYQTDLEFKAEITLYTTLIVNLIYSCFKAFAGIYYHSIWFGTVALYYIILSIERFVLLHHLQRKEQNSRLAIKKYCLSGYLLLTLTIIIIAMSFYILQGGKIVTYPTYFIYVVAGYTFYSFSIAIVNIFRYRKNANLMYQASKMITLATAFIAIYSLQIAMFAEFSNNYQQQKIMNLLVGIIIFIIVISIAIYMIVHGKKLMYQNSINSKRI